MVVVLSFFNLTHQCHLGLNPFPSHPVILAPAWAQHPALNAGEELLFGSAGLGAGILRP